MGGAVECDKRTQGFEEYPVVKLVSFEQMPVPDNFLFPAWIMKYGGSNGFPVPSEVQTFFREDIGGKRASIGSDLWQLEGSWERGDYYKMGEDQRDNLFDWLVPYFERLQELKGTHVEAGQVLPDLPRSELGRNLRFEFPERWYDLEFTEEEQGNVVIATCPRTLGGSVCYVPEHLKGEVVVARMQYKLPVWGRAKDN